MTPIKQAIAPLMARIDAFGRAIDATRKQLTIVLAVEVAVLAVIAVEVLRTL